MRSRRDFWSDNDQDTACLFTLRFEAASYGWFLRVKQVDIALLFCLEGVTELKWREMSSITFISHTNTHAVRGRPTLKRC